MLLWSRTIPWKRRPTYHSTLIRTWSADRSGDQRVVQKEGRSVVQKVVQKVVRKEGRSEDRKAVRKEGRSGDRRGGRSVVQREGHSEAPSVDCWGCLLYTSPSPRD